MAIFTTPTLELLARAIDASALRQGVYASNVANAGIEGYRRMEVTFDSQLAQLDALVSAGTDAPGGSFGAAPSIVATDAAVKLDEEIGRMATNSLRYQVLMNAFERSVGTLRLAVREGRE
jgi:flagellar basal-body rod protein FlgB